MNEMRKAYDMYRGGEVYTEIWQKPARDHLEELGVDERIILKWIYKKCN